MKLYRKCDNLSIGIFLTGPSDFLTYKSGATMPVGSLKKALACARTQASTAVSP